MSLRDRIVRAATPFLEEGETIEVATVAAIGKETVTRQAARSAAVALAVAVVTAGTLTSVFTPGRKLPVVLTNRRLLLLDADQLFGFIKKKVLGAIAREGLSARQLHSPLWRAYELVDNTGAGVLRLSFSLPNRKAGDQIADALGVIGRS